MILANLGKFGQWFFGVFEWVGEGVSCIIIIIIK